MSDDTGPLIEHGKELGRALERLDVMDAALAAMGGVKASVDDLHQRLDGVIATQAETLERLAKLEPVQAVETEVDGDVDAVDPFAEPGHAPPEGVPSGGSRGPSPLRKFHNLFG